MSYNYFMQKNILFAGAILIVAGILTVLFALFGKQIHLFRLPGNIVIEKENFHFYFPIVSGILISIVLTVILNLLLRIFKH